MFGKEVGFINLQTKPMLGPTRLPGYIFLRGHAVAILMLINGQVLLVRQFRPAVCQWLLEAPAGMVD